jgi:single-strand DNA-binding protein
MSFEIEGVLVKKYDIENKTSSFQTREFVITTEGTYPQFVKFQLTQDKCQIVDSCNEGERIKVFFDLRGREWQGKYFTNLNAWKVEIAKSAESGQIMSGDFPPAFDTQTSKTTDDLPETFDDLPF